MTVEATSPTPAVAPAGPRHATTPVCPNWCDPRRCVIGRHGRNHIGTPTRWYSTAGSEDIEYSLAYYQAPDESRRYLFTMRRLGTSGVYMQVMNDSDIDGFATARARLQLTETAAPVADEADAHAAVTA